MNPRSVFQDKRWPSIAAVAAAIGMLTSSCSPAASSVAETGGAPGSGGNAASGGRSGTGGLLGSGGNSASGGSTGSGGQLGTGGANATGGAPGTGGQVANGGAPGTGGVSVGGSAGVGGRDGTGGAVGGGGRGGTGGGSRTGGAGGGSTNPMLAKFSFFVVSLPSIVALSGKPAGFGGDLRFAGKTDGLSGADEICRQAAERGLAGAGQKQWRAFLSVTAGPGGGAVNARDRIGVGPWYDRLGRLISNDLAGLFAADRPAGDAAAVNDLPTENGEPNHYVGPGGLGAMVVDNHDTLTGSDKAGNLLAANAAATCNDWTSTTVAGRPMTGHSWPRSATMARNWSSEHAAPGCAAGIDVTLGGTGSGGCVGCGGGYGGFYCFALP